MVILRCIHGHDAGLSPKRRRQRQNGEDSGVTRSPGRGEDDLPLAHRARSLGDEHPYERTRPSALGEAPGQYVP